eukprot:TRINITY_DN1644_c0_g1_i2.p1 TRINITY_DN1644_c0_g1~~TRINITY_DN1644_c0_g1_i2.p1  ORF type:complete len:587 (+),score=178.57 TRINITY_DN1644_c0_g1_i2:130-1890(+)
MSPGDGPAGLPDHAPERVEATQRAAADQGAPPHGDAKGHPPKPPAAAAGADKKPALENGAILKGKWKIMGKIGQGAFGETYVGESICGEANTVAIKVERPTGAARRDVLKTEVIALKKLQQCPSVVRYLSSGKDETHQISFLVMQRLGNDLAELKRRTKKTRLELATTIRLGVQMLESIRGVHELHYIHRDIKPSNFVVGREDSGKIYLIDFGLARRYRSNDGEIRPARQPAGFRGTARYASIHSHKQMELGRRDDLWCLFYVLVEFRLEGGLPWRRHKDKNTIGEMKERYTNEKLVEKLPTEFYLFMKHLFSLRYESEPNYYYLKQLLESIAENDDIALDQPLEWQRDEAATTQLDEVPPTQPHSNGPPGPGAAPPVEKPAPPASLEKSPRKASVPEGKDADAASAGVVELQILDDFEGGAGAKAGAPDAHSNGKHGNHADEFSTAHGTPAPAGANGHHHNLPSTPHAPTTPPRHQSVDANPIDTLPRPTGFAIAAAPPDARSSGPASAKEPALQHAKSARPSSAAAGTLYTEAAAHQERRGDADGEGHGGASSRQTDGGKSQPEDREARQEGEEPSPCKCCEIM